MKQEILSKLLYKKEKTIHQIGFILSGFIGLCLILISIQVYRDIHPILSAQDSFINNDYKILNKRIKSGLLFFNKEKQNPYFSQEEIQNISQQKWVKDIAPFLSSQYRVDVRVDVGSIGKQFSSLLFFESIPDRFIDVKTSKWTFNPNNPTIPLILPRNYLSLYNFGFAPSQGLPRITQSMISAIPLRFDLIGENGIRLSLRGHIVGLSDRINSILVPDKFLRWSNEKLSSTIGSTEKGSRIILKIDPSYKKQITHFLQLNNYTFTSKNGNTEINYFVSILLLFILFIGFIITLLSALLIVYSTALWVGRNRDKIEKLVLLGYSPRVLSIFNAKRLIYSGLIVFCLSTVVLIIVQLIIKQYLIVLTNHITSIYLTVLLGLILEGIIVGLNIWILHKRIIKIAS